VCVCAGLSLVVMCVEVGDGVGGYAAACAGNGWVYGFASSFRSFFLFSSSWFIFRLLEHSSQTALTMPLAEPLASLPVAVVFLFT
jgi:hypothetical protein